MGQIQLLINIRKGSIPDMAYGRSSRSSSHLPFMVR